MRGKHILGLDIGLPTERLKQPIRSCLTGAKDRVDLQLDAINRRGRAIEVRLSACPLRSRSQSIHGVVLLMEAADDAPHEWYEALRTADSADEGERLRIRFTKTGARDAMSHERCDASGGKRRALNLAEMPCASCFERA